MFDAAMFWKRMRRWVVGIGVLDGYISTALGVLIAVVLRASVNSLSSRGQAW
jgi:hypothetical protein